MIRVIDVDRKKKRITVSLQSDSRLADEARSDSAWKERRRAKEAKEKKDITLLAGDAYTKQTDAASQDQTKYLSIETEEENVAPQPIVIDEENMTPAELKRARKLQRRAERRKQRELTGIAA